MAQKRRHVLRFLGAGALGLAAPYRVLAHSLQRKVKITDVKVIIVRGAWDWNLVKIETDAGVYGIGEAYRGPGVRDLILRQFKPLLVGEDPMNVARLYKKQPAGRSVRDCGSGDS